MPSRRAKALARVSLISELLPEPLTPVTHTKADSGIRTSMSFRLFVVTPSIVMEWVLLVRRRCVADGQPQASRQVASCD